MDPSASQADDLRLRALLPSGQRTMKASASRIVAAPPERVFAAATDFANAAGRIRAIRRMRMLTDGPVRVGTRFEETRFMFGREASETMEVVALDPPRSIVLGAQSHGCRYRTEMRFEPEGAGTRVTTSFEGTPLTLPAKIMSLMLAPFAKKIAGECAKDLDDLAAHVEAG